MCRDESRAHAFELTYAIAPAGSAELRNVGQPATDLPTLGSYSSAVKSPPTINTRPSLSRVAMWPLSVSVIEPVGLKVPVSLPDVAVILAEYGQVPRKCP